MFPSSSSPFTSGGGAPGHGSSAGAGTGTLSASSSARSLSQLAGPHRVGSLNSSLLSALDTAADVVVSSASAAAFTRPPAASAATRDATVTADAFAGLLDGDTSSDSPPIRAVPTAPPGLAGAGAVTAVGGKRSTAPAAPATTAQSIDATANAAAGGRTSGPSSGALLSALPLPVSPMVAAFPSNLSSSRSSPVMQQQQQHDSGYSGYNQSATVSRGSSTSVSFNTKQIQQQQQHHQVGFMHPLPQQLQFQQQQQQYQPHLNNAIIVNSDLGYSAQPAIDYDFDSDAHLTDASVTDDAVATGATAAAAGVMTRAEQRAAAAARKASKKLAQEQKTRIQMAGLKLMFLLFLAAGAIPLLYLWTDAVYAAEVARFVPAQCMVATIARRNVTVHGLCPDTVNYLFDVEVFLPLEYGIAFPQEACSGKRLVCYEGDGAVEGAPPCRSCEPNTIHGCRLPLARDPTIMDHLTPGTSCFLS